MCYLYESQFSSFLMLAGSCLIFMWLIDGGVENLQLLLVRGMLYLERLTGVLPLLRLGGVTSSSLEKASDVADSWCIQSHNPLLPTKSRGTLLPRRARANCRQPCGWSKVFRFLKTSFTKSTILLPWMTSPPKINPHLFVQPMSGLYIYALQQILGFSFHHALFGNNSQNLFLDILW